VHAAAISKQDNTVPLAFLVDFLTNEFDCPAYFEEAIMTMIADQKTTPDYPGYLVEVFSMTLIS
jgi:hypothetical protein